MTDFFKKLGVNPGSGDGLKNAAAGVLGNMFGNAVKPHADQAAQQVNNGINAAAEKANEGISFIGKNIAAGKLAYNISNLPDDLSLNKSPAMTMFVENGFAALGLFKGKPDGTADGKTLEAMNKFRAGMEPYLDPNQFTKDDFKALTDTLKTAAEKEGNAHAANVLTQANGAFFDKVGEAYPKPQAAAPARSNNADLGLTGG